MSTTEKISQEIFYACFSHIPIHVDYPDFVTPIYLGEASNLGALNLPSLAPAWEKYHPILGGTAGSFALNNYLKTNKSTQKYVGICQYRKFVSHFKIGVTADNYQVMDVTTNHALNKSSLAEAMIAKTIKPLISQPGQFLHHGHKYNYLYQYKDVHHIEDILRFTAQLVENNVIDKEDAYLFLNEEIFIPGGLELGIYPIDFWMNTMTQLEKVVSACISLFPTNREGYQSRAWAFCMERIGSYLILKELKKDPEWPSNYFGYLNLINDDGSNSYTPGV